MTKKTKEWWASQAHLYGRQVGELLDVVEKLKSDCVMYKHEAHKNHQMAVAVNAKMKRCQDMIEHLVDELTKAKYKGKNEELLEDARTYLQIAVQGQYVRSFLDYGEHAENISKSGYNAAKLDKLTAESLKKLHSKKNKK